MKRIALIATCLIGTAAFAQERPLSDMQSSMSNSIDTISCQAFLAIMNDELPNSKLLKGILIGYILGSAKENIADEKPTLEPIHRFCEIDPSRNFAEVVLVFSLNENQ